MAQSISVISEWKEEVMIGRIEKDFTKDESTKQIYQTENYKIVSYPAIVNGKCNGRLRVELQHNDKNDVFSQSHIEIISKYLPNYHIDHLQNVFSSKAEMRRGVNYNPMLIIFKFQQIQIELEEENILQKSLDMLK